MEIDLEKLQKSIIYLGRITEGKNPVNNLPAEEDSVINNPNVIRCMFFIKEVLEEVQRNGGQIQKKKSTRAVEKFPLEHISKFKYEADKPISHLVSQINEGLDTDKYKKIGYRIIQDWLLKNGYLAETYIEKVNSNRKIPTEKGRAIGIRGEWLTGSQGKEYLSIIYNEKAQGFIVEHMEEILE